MNASRIGNDGKSGWTGDLLYVRQPGDSDFGLDVVAISGAAKASSFNGNVKLELLANTGGGYGPTDNCPIANSLIQTIASAAIASGRSTIGIAAVNNVYKDVRVRISYPTVAPTITICSTDSFSVRPEYLAVTSTNASNNNTSGGTAIKTGSNFNLTATANATILGVATVMTNYAGTVAAVDNTLVIGSSNAGTIAGSFANPAVAGVASGSSFTYSEVGNFGLSANAVHDDTFTGVDQTTDCTNDFSTTPVGGKVGCKIGSAAIAQTAGTSGFGRFIPDHFTVTTATLTPACVSGLTNNTYMGQPFALGVVVEARNATDVLTKNYQGSYVTSTTAGLVAEDQAVVNQGVNLAGRISGFAIPAWTNGRYTISTSVALFSRPAIPAATPLDTVGGGPFDLLAIGIKVVDPDGVIITSPTMDMRADTNSTCTVPGTASGTDCNATQIGTAISMRYGQLALSNAYGSNLIDLLVPVRADYISAMSGSVPTFSLNTHDSCTNVPAASMSLSSP